MPRPRKTPQKGRARKKFVPVVSDPRLALQQSCLGTKAFNPRVLILTYREFQEKQSPVQVYRFTRMICAHPSFDTLPFRMKNFFTKILPDTKLTAQRFTEQMGQRLREGKPLPTFPK